MKTKRTTKFAAILFLAALSFTSCSPERVIDALLPSGYMMLVKESGSPLTINLMIDADEKDRKDVWIDFDANLRRAEDGSEDVVKKFGVMQVYQLSARQFNLAGKITRLDCSGNDLVNFTLINNKALTYLDCSNNLINDFQIAISTENLTTIKCQRNSISGGMLVTYLPDRTGKTEGTITLIDTSNSKENNQVTKEHIADIKKKNWKPIDASTGKEYAGS